MRKKALLRIGGLRPQYISMNLTPLPHKTGLNGAPYWDSGVVGTGNYQNSDMILAGGIEIPGDISEKSPENGEKCRFFNSRGAI